jgi:hypothetical protein
MTTQAQVTVAATEYPRTAQNRVNRHSERGRYAKDEIYPIVDEALICHVGIVAGDQPFVIPMIHARVGDALYLHGAPASRLLQHVRAGRPICVTITLIDGVVFARAAFKHSLNYRSVVLFGNGRVVDDDAEKMAAFEAVTEHIAPGRWADARLPTRKELAATLVAAVDIDSASAKVRTGPPFDDADDLTLPIWAGVLPLALTAQTPTADERLPSIRPVPDYIAHYQRPR